MKLVRKKPGSEGFEFTSENLVTTHELFTRKSELVLDGDEHVEQRKFADNGLFSPRIFGDMDTKEEYACECGTLTGKFYEGKICQKCGTKVTFRKMNIDKFGWIDLSLSKYDENGNATPGNGFHIIQYVAYSQLEKIIGRENLRNIIQVRNTININGDIDETEITEIRNEQPKNKYYFYGLEKLYDNYEEILNYYRELNEIPATDKLYTFLRDEKDSVFTDKIPVISIILRPAMRTAEGLKLDQMNIEYQNILKNVEILQDEDIIDIIRDLTIEQIQAQYMQLSEEILDNVKAKAGLIRNQICGTRVNFSARNIISPAKAGVKMDEVILPYLTFLELYRFEIINVIKEIKNITYKEAEVVWYNATLKLDTEVYKIMCKIIEDNEIGTILNRNPTIAYGSMLYLKVKGVKADYDDVTMSIHNSILTCLAGDYDGDVLNLISIKDKTTRELFKQVFSPIHLIIDPNNGQFNDSLNLERDQVLGLNSLLN